jgi:hypothetical protein
MPDQRLSVLNVASVPRAPAPCMTTRDPTSDDFAVVDPAAPDIADREADMAVVVALVSYAFYLVFRAIAGVLRKAVRYA